MTVNCKKQIFLSILFVFLAGSVSSQRIDMNRVLSPVMEDMKKQYPILTRLNLVVDKSNIDAKRERIDIHLGKNFESIPIVKRTSSVSTTTYAKHCPNI